MITASNANLAEMMHDIGVEINPIKIEVRNKGLMFEPWADENFPNLKERTRNKCMRLAKIPFFHDYKILGSERLLLINSVCDNTVSNPTQCCPVKNLHATIRKN